MHSNKKKTTNNVNVNIHSNMCVHPCATYFFGSEFREEYIRNMDEYMQTEAQNQMSLVHVLTRIYIYI